MVDRSDRKVLRRTSHLYRIRRFIITKKHGKQHGSNVVGTINPRPIRDEPVSQGNVGLPEEREYMIAEAAYFRAERRGFAPGNEMEDWLQAETEIDSLIQSGGSRSACSVETA